MLTGPEEDLPFPQAQAHIRVYRYDETALVRNSATEHFELVNQFSQLLNVNMTQIAEVFGPCDFPACALKDALKLRIARQQLPTPIS